MNNHNHIRSAPCPVCKVCGSSGVQKYKGIPDRLFSSPGLWSFRQCLDPKCGLMWLDPMPLEKDIYKAYQSYYTHGQDSQKKGWIQQPLMTHLFRMFLWLIFIHKERRDLDLMFLVGIKPGRLLEVGCGDGTRLRQLAELGWYVEGQEVDPVSVSIAKKTNFKIHLGPLEHLNLPNSSYDAIVMSHVIEHVHEPVKLLSECHRLLKKDGILVAVTPNIRSYGHKVFKSSWLHLDPPRHIMIYSQESLNQIARKAGFEHPISWTTSVKADGPLRSLQIVCGKQRSRLPVKAFCYFGALVLLPAARLVQLFDKDSGEECILKLRK
jgi:2-polyprenyl-3-methyl-5-hydroxy-6-metoxy-1,4-benzoquinol methylase